MYFHGFSELSKAVFHKNGLSPCGWSVSALVHDSIVVLSKRPVFMKGQKGCANGPSKTRGLAKF